jgi:hypothetical protein
MKPTQKTTALFVVFLVFLALNFVDVGTGQRISEQLPTLQALDRKTVDRIELSSATWKIVMEGVDEETTSKPVKVWHLVAPIEGDADQIAVRTLVSQFRKEIPLDAKVDAGNLEDYGLDAGNGLVVELFEGSDEPSVSFTLGKEGPGGSTFIRLSGDDAIYRARVGGRHRYDKPPAEWRNKVLLGFQELDADKLTVFLNGAEEPSLGFVRAPPPPGEESEQGPWELSPDPGWPTDQELITGIVKSLGTVRASQIMGKDFDAGFSPPAVTVVVRLIDGSERAIEVGQRTSEGAAFARRANEQEVFRISAVPIQRLLGRPIDYRDRTMFHFDRSDIDTLSWEGGTERVILQQDLATNLWNVLEPQNIDLDVKFVFFAANNLGGLRGDGIADVTLAQAGLDRPRATITTRLLSGEEHTLTIGGKTRAEDTGQPMHYAQSDTRPEIFLLNDKVVTTILRGFGRQ